MTMNDDDLILYYYEDGLSEAERRRIRAMLEEDASLRARYERLCGDLERFDAPHPVTPPTDMVARWHDSIDRAARFERQALRPPRAFHLPSFAWGSAVAAALVLGLGFFLARDRAIEPIPNGGVVTTSGTTVDRPALVAFERGLQVHLQQSNQEIVDLPADADEQRAMLIMRMVQENRSFEAAAERNGAGDLARVLRAFEPILMQLASQNIAPAEARALQAQLTFELNVMLTKLGRNVSDGSDPI
jgi:hypothetical protein